MIRTDNFNLKVYEGADLFNPLTVENDNVETIDGQMYANQTAALQSATELFSNNIHAITRAVSDAPAFRFTAVSNFTAGDTFTVDNEQVSAFLTSGEALPSGAFVVGSEVIGILKGTRLTIMTSSATAAKATDADALGGHEADYYATAEALNSVNSVATGAGSVATSALNKAEALESKFSGYGESLSNSGNTSLPNNASTTIGSISLQPGVYFIKSLVTFPSNQTGVRGTGIGRIYHRVGAVAGSQEMSDVGVISVTEPRELSVFAIQTSGSALNVYWSIIATKLG